MCEGKAMPRRIVNMTAEKIVGKASKFTGRVNAGVNGVNSKRKILTVLRIFSRDHQKTIDGLCVDCGPIVIFQVLMKSRVVKHQETVLALDPQRHRRHAHQQRKE